MPHKNFLTLILTITVITGITFSQPAVWVSKGIGGGGALFSPSFNPNNPNELYAACDMSELFKTTDLGVTWDPINFNSIQGGNNSEVQFINGNSNLLYCINHKNDLQTPSKSIDGGVIWTALTGDPTG